MLLLYVYEVHERFMRGSTGEGGSQFSSKDMHKELRSKISSSWLTQETSETIYLATLSKEVVALNHSCRKISRSEVQKLSKDMLFEVVYIYSNLLPCFLVTI